MSKIVFFCIPAHGHTNPTLGVVRALLADGHEVRYYSYESMREKIEATGAQFVACDALDPQTGLSPEDGARIGRDLAFSTRLIVDMTLALDDAIAVDMRELQPDVIVGDSMAFWAKLIAQKMNIPFVSSTTTFAYNQHSAKLMQKKSLGELLRMVTAAPKINRQLARLRAHGYPVKSVLQIIANDNDTRTIVYTAPEFQPCAETFSDKYSFVGASIRPITEPLEKADRPTVYISLGTVVNLQSDFYRACIEAFRDGEYRVVLSVGEYTDPAAFEPLPPHMICTRRADQMAVLSVADVFLTHCGMNSANEAMYFGVPLVLYPQTPEQGAVAKRTEALHAGLLLKKADAASIRQTVDAVLRDASYRANAQVLSRAFHRCGGAEQAARVIEQAAEK